MKKFKELFKRNKLDIRDKIQDIKKIYKNEEKYPIEKLKDRIIELDYMMSKMKLDDITYNIIKDLIAILPMFVTILSVFISLKFDKKSILHFGALLSGTIVISAMSIVMISSKRSNEEIKKSEYVMEKSIILLEIEKRENKSNRNKRIHDNIRR